MNESITKESVEINGDMARTFWNWLGNKLWEADEEINCPMCESYQSERVAKGCPKHYQF